MKTNIYAIPQFCLYIENSEELFPLLITLSRHHYDATCREASNEAKAAGDRNGFLTMWFNDKRFHDEAAANPYILNRPNSDFYVKATRHQIDITLKIMELAYNHPFIAMNRARIKIIEDFQIALRRVLMHYPDITKDWKGTIDP